MTDINLSAKEPAPIHNDQSAVWDLVLRDIADRDTIGVERYGTHLQAFNGREPIVDAYQEALDFIVYIRQGIEEYRQYRAVLKQAVYVLNQVAALEWHGRYLEELKVEATVVIDLCDKFRLE